MNGQGSESNVFQIDGVSGNVGAGNGGGYSSKGTGGALPVGTALGTTQSLVSVDDLQEFRVATSSYSAEFGRGAGGQISFVTRSGENQFHGTAYDYLRNNVFDANDFFNKFYQPVTPRQPLRQNDFGGTFGGPVVIPKIFDGHNKAFFFYNYEGLRLVQPTASYTAYVPNKTFRQDAATGSAIQEVLNSFPVANGPSVLGNDAVPDLAAYVSGYSNTGQIDSQSARVDYAISPRESIFYRFSNTPSAAGQESAGLSGTVSSNTRTSTLGLTSTLSAGITNELRANYTSNAEAQAFQPTSQNGSMPVNILTAAGYPSNTPSYSFAIALDFGYANSVPLYDYKGVNANRQFNITDGLSYAKGRHQFKFGADFKRLTSTDLTESPYSGFYFYDTADTLANNLGYAFIFANKNFFPLFRALALYAQDDWRATERLTVSAGLRWELNPAATSRRGPQPLELLNQNDPTQYAFAPEGTPIYETSFTDYAPRLGISYIANRTNGHETVVRLGGGLYDDPVTNQVDTLIGFEGPGYNNTVSFCSYSYCNTVGNFGFPLPETDLNPPIQFPPQFPITSTMYAYSPRLSTPRSVQYSAALQQMFGSKNSVTVTFVGAESRKYIGYQEKDVNGINPNWNNVFIAANQLSSSYHSGQVTFQREYARGLYVYAGYAWSHNIGSLQINSYTPYERTNQGTDLRHSFNAAAAWTIPAPTKSIVMRSAFSGWEVDPLVTARTGFPLELFGTYTSGAMTAGTSQTPNLNYVPGVPVYVYGIQYPGGRALNKNAFTNAPLGAIGTVPQNSYRGPGEATINITLQRNFTLHDRLLLNFRAEAFNVFNHTNFGSVDTGLGDPAFGQITSTLSTSLGSGVQSPLYASGGARSLQLALKLSF